ncbi:Chemotaxis protein CheY [Gemmata obscuriglobus]|uniref:Response regulator n=1 Tax=Gemmata obscuriglobus TaxID=114 RepID=A0A2Z3GWZ1_9BACT|nr:response regulator [Gemmata obscuriglobus]AWM38979.1 response regulator [Gemmata obscuriglobus]QEG28001.1 Chemotaxis protein CheY [Gemmata obscuriglobus]VTS05528.1 transcriptional regulator : Two component transcriptional regulator, LuxR family OS=Calothrix sp. PCC 7507 GN=Cal7507_0031 PE=4 SV=1: Response_reg [Gemmata obscuriglobus UQM 2246]
MSADAREGPVKPLRVLVVDDDADTLDSQLDLLGLCGFAVGTAADGEEALRTVLADRPDVVVTDLRMPRCSGSELARRVSAAGLSPRPFLVAATGCQGTMLREAEQAGFDLILMKPVEPAVLVGLLRRIERALH